MEWAPHGDIPHTLLLQVLWVGLFLDEPDFISRRGMISIALLVGMDRSGSKQTFSDTATRLGRIFEIYLANGQARQVGDVLDTFQDFPKRRTYVHYTRKWPTECNARPILTTSSVPLSKSSIEIVRVPGRPRSSQSAPVETSRMSTTRGLSRRDPMGGISSHQRKTKHLSQPSCWRILRSIEMDLTAWVNGDGRTSLHGFSWV